LSQRLRIIANLQSGGTNPMALREVWNAVGRDRLLQLNTLHAKVFVSDRCLIVGSANVSANGLGAEGREVDGWFEACLRTDDRQMIEQAQRWFADRWTDADAIEPEHFEAAIEAWKRERRRRPITNRGTTDPQGLRDLSWETLEGRGIYVAISSEYMSDSGAQTVHDAFSNDPTVDGYEDWSQMPVGATLLAFDVDLESNPFRVTWDGAWTTPPDKKSRRSQTVNNVTLIHKAHPEDALGITEDNCGPWERDIRALCERFKNSRTGLPQNHTWNDWCLPVEDAWWLLINLDMDERLDSVSDEALRDHIRLLSEGGRSFQSTDLIRAVVGRYYRDRERRGMNAPNVRFAKRLSDTHVRLGIREFAPDENVRDDAGGPSMTSRWKRIA
jgi:hypothetical protein